ncbi:SCO family protein [Salipiger sp.]|uniref:SCO family protein n=1 Tax=Salipiger sp. TaxID=2078585 RepID=UPI003A976CE2
MRALAALAAALVLVALSGGIWYATRSSGDGDMFADCRSAKIAGGADAIGGSFTLVDSTGATVTDKDVITEPSLVYFGYTFCPDVCPLDMVRNAEAVDVLAERGRSVTPVFISIDPERDTPEVVGDFAYNIHEKMIGLTGSPEQVAAASKAYRTYFKKNDSGDEYYLVDHSTFTYLVLPEQGFVEFFRRDLPPEQLADRAQCFLDRI